ncbi:2-keto-4-pentenoate hydratase [Terriglobus tenax]|uniref:2-keto-4-pentenoate hydratase n=1 Tax=Terriglobus tenax TaxID=1111115 RepID=UPI0021E08729|nr:2-keto-4-pentenoate hydratase [Terriglobus tenax]
MSQNVLTAARESELLSLANLLLDARRTGRTIDALPENLVPTSQQEAYFVQDQMAEAYGEIGGYKVGAPSPTAEPFFAPMPAAWMSESSVTLTGPGHRLRILEGEVAFRFGKDLPPRSTPYTYDEIAAAIASANAVIEILESAFTDPKTTPSLAVSADMQYHGAFVHGPAFENWQTIDWATESVELVVDGVVREQRTGSNPGGTDLFRLLSYVVNEGAARTGGLRAGQWVTTGSWTGNTPASSDAEASVKFTHSARVKLYYAS